ncbi:NUDIX domain-containing protein [soil metagenome]
MTQPWTAPQFHLTVDLVVLTVRDAALQALIVTRGAEPYAGRLALPGGFVHAEEDPLDAAERELREETGVTELRGHLEQLATYGRVDRDPRGRVVSIAWLALVPDPGPPTAGTDAAAAAWHPVDALAARSLAFGHDQILTDGVERARSKLEYTPLGAAFCPPAFTINELREVYQAVWGVDLDPRNFHRKVSGTPGFVIATGGRTTRGGGRPARLYRVGDVTLLHPAMLRPS